jgi:hypothetical protein
VVGCSCVVVKVIALTCFVMHLFICFGYFSIGNTVVFAVRQCETHLVVQFWKCSSCFSNLFLVFEIDVCLWQNT